MDLPFLTPIAPDQIADAGVPGRWSYGVRDRVRFAEIDQLNHVNNVAYLQWFEMIRVRYFVEWGMTRYGPGDPQVVMRAQTAEYLAPMHLNQDYLVACRTINYRNTSFTIEYICFSEGVKVTGQSVIVMVEPDGKTKRLLPDDLVSRFRDIDGATKT